MLWNKEKINIKKAIKRIEKLKEKYQIKLLFNPYNPKVAQLVIIDDPNKENIWLEYLTSNTEAILMSKVETVKTGRFW